MPIIVFRIKIFIHKIIAFNHFSRQIFMCVIDSGIDNRDNDRVVSLFHIPAADRVNTLIAGIIQGILGGKKGIVRHGKCVVPIVEFGVFDFIQARVST